MAAHSDQDVRVARFAFKPEEGSNEVRVEKGERFVVLKSADGWLKGQVEGAEPPREGWAPESYFATEQQQHQQEEETQQHQEQEPITSTTAPEAPTDAPAAGESEDRNSRTHKKRRKKKHTKTKGSTDHPHAKDPPPSAAAAGKSTFVPSSAPITDLAPSPSPSRSVSPPSRPKPPATRSARATTVLATPSVRPKIRITDDSSLTTSSPASSAGPTSNLLVGLPASFLSQFPSASGPRGPVSPRSAAPSTAPSTADRHRSGEYKPTGETGLAYYNDIVRQGWLHKKGEKRTNWLRRWFVLRGLHLSYFTGSDMLKKKGEIDLNDATECRVEPDAEKPHMFSIHLSARVYHCRAEDFEDMRHWIRAISGVIKNRH